MMPTREEAKHTRRKRILRAARDLVRETEKTGFSMRALAERADVSLVTPYNLLGSKQAIMFALLDEDIQQYARRLRRSKKNELELIFEAVTLGRKFFEKEPEYYRTVLFAVYNDGGREYRSMFRGPRRALWSSLVEAAVEAKYLKPEVDTDAFSINLALIYFAAILDWVAGEMSLEEMEIRTQYGFALSLLAVAMPRHRDQIHGHLMKMQGKLGRLSSARRKSEKGSETQAKADDPAAGGRVKAAGAS